MSEEQQPRRWGAHKRTPGQIAYELLASLDRTGYRPGMADAAPEERQRIEALVLQFLRELQQQEDDEDS